MLAALRGLLAKTVLAGPVGALRLQGPPPLGHDQYLLVVQSVPQARSAVKSVVCLGARRRVLQALQHGTDNSGHTNIQGVFLEAQEASRVTAAASESTLDTS